MAPKFVLYCVVQLGILAYSFSQHNPGDKCVDVFEREGVCKSIRDCPEANIGMKKGIPPTPCSFKVDDHIVCCAGKEGAEAMEDPMAKDEGVSSEAEKITEKNENEEMKDEEETKGTDVVQEEEDERIKFEEEGLISVEMGGKEMAKNETSDEKDVPETEEGILGDKTLYSFDELSSYWSNPIFREHTLFSDASPFAYDSRVLEQWPYVTDYSYGSLGLGGLAGVKALPQPPVIPDIEYAF